ncbi:cobalamin-binding protein [Ectothiorhodospira mobilis]|uniref:cobalamin-binding protein n=1 Tax=Ectothiorhodospira mobilis TaxID=195064 RepID=UPI001903D58D|nr:cobalamin-binding protein [Ectothiorhodospira mobilis]MBK1691574.1 cobalamin-binding protein [Ectothiorhodospira mobilis]
MTGPETPEQNPKEERKWPLLAAIFALIIAILVLPHAHAEPLIVTDDRGRQVQLQAPAKRIISLAPHITENLFAVGVGERIVGTVNFSDHPGAALEIPRVGSYKQLDLESIIALEPDLIIAWEAGNVRSQLERLEAMGHTLYYSDPRDIRQLAQGLETLGRLAGHPQQGHQTARELEQALEGLRDRYAGRSPVTVFYQVWDRPLMTLNGEHIISQVIRLCGGRNVFGHLDAAVPRLNREVVLAADPEVIMGGGMGEEDPQWVEDWRRWTQMTAVARDNLFFIPPSLLQRPTPRLAAGARRVCQALEQARQRRPEDTE